MTLTRLPSWCTKVSSKLIYARQYLEHRKANKLFEAVRRVEAIFVEELFSPELAYARAVVQAVVRPHDSVANMPVHELILMSTICSYLKPMTIFEFGTYNGLTTLHLAMNCPEDAKVITIDLHPDDPIRLIDGSNDTSYVHDYSTKIGGWFHHMNEASKIEQIYGNSVEFNHDPLFRTIDFIFVDAGHDYELVRSDSKKALDMLCPGGIIIWHDYHYTQTGVYTWLNELAASIQLSNIQGTSLVCHLSKGG